MEVSVLERCPSYGMSVLRGFTVHMIDFIHGTENELNIRQTQHYRDVEELAIR